MPQPANHTFHVSMQCDGPEGATEDFKMPAWTPGFYRILDYARYVSHFRARDGAGRELGWEKTTRNAWRVETDGARSATLDYDVLAALTFGAQNYLGADRGYISPAGLYLYPAGQLRHAVTVTIELPPDWHQMASGLDAVAGSENTFSAPEAISKPVFSPPGNPDACQILVSANTEDGHFEFTSHRHLFVKF